MDEEKAQELERLLFTTTNPADQIHRCAVVFDKYHAISYRHGSVHSAFKKDDAITLYNVKDPHYKVEVVVLAFSALFDFIVFKSLKEEFRSSPIDSSGIYQGMRYLQLGISRDKKVVWKDGIISKKHHGFYVGTFFGEGGDSGSGIFNAYGHICGISVAKKNFFFLHS